MKIGAIIPYRMGSTRLPRKPLTDIAGKPAIERVSNRVLRSKYISNPHQIVVATTTEQEDDELSEYVLAHGLSLYRGSSHDVLGRIWAAAREHCLDCVIEVDGDDLFCAPEYMDMGVSILNEEHADWVSFRGLPLGATPNILRTRALGVAVVKNPYADTSTGFFRFLTDFNGFRVLKPTVIHPEHVYDGLRMTLDYKEDIAFFTEVFKELDGRDRPISFGELVELLRSRPDLVALNAGLEARYSADFQAAIARTLKEGEDL